MLQRFIQRVLLLFAIGTTQMPFAQIKEQPTYCVVDSLFLDAYSGTLSKQLIEQRIDKIQAKVASNGQSSNPTASISGCTKVYTIPVVFHVIHDPSDNVVGVGSNISDARILDQLNVMNEEFNGPNSNSLGVNTCIQFCLATIPPTGESWSTMPGVVRVGSTQTDHEITTVSQWGLQNASGFPPEEYLNIWVVSSINGGSGILGYAPFPIIPTSSLDGIVIRHSVVGTGLTPPYDQGKVMVHEVGHYLGLFHTFHLPGECGTPTEGDYIADTPTALEANYGCQTGASGLSCGSQDQVQNHMDYSDDNCKSTFTQGQKEWMHAVIESTPDRAQMVSMLNLINTGVAASGGCVEPAITSEFTLSQSQVCIINDTMFLTGASAYDQWTFTLQENNSGSTYTLSGTGTPDTFFTFSSIGMWDIELYVENTVTAPLGFHSTYKPECAFSIECNPITGTGAHWYFGRFARMNFTSGTAISTSLPFPAVTMPNGGMYTWEASVSVSDSLTGYLDFFTDGRSLWTNNHTMSPNGNETMIGSPNSYPSPASNNCGVTAFPNPDTSSNLDYYIFTSTDKAIAPGPYDINGLTYYGVDMNLNSGQGDLVSTTPSHPIHNYGTIESIAATQVENDTTYWVVTNGTTPYVSVNPGPPLTVTHTGAPIEVEEAILAYKITPSGVNGIPIVSDNGPMLIDGDTSTGFYGNGWIGNTKFSQERSLMVMHHRYTGQMEIYDFDKETGKATHLHSLTPPALAPSPFLESVEFSPSGKFIYATGSDYIYQCDITNVLVPQVKVVPFNGEFFFPQFKIGPDDRIYMTNSLDEAVSVINFPDSLCTNANPNACGINYHGVPLGSYQECRMPPNPLQITNPPTKDFELYASNCFDVTVRSIYCGENITWDFNNDLIPDVGYTDRVETFTFGGAGTYTINAWIDGTLVTHSITLTGLASPVITPQNFCDGQAPIIHSISNYMTADSIQTYDWSVTSGGTIVNADYLEYVESDWSASGTISVTVTNHQGCSATASSPVIVSSVPDITSLNSSSPCYCDADLSASISGGTTPFTYDWVNETTSTQLGSATSLTNVCPGTYSLTVVDAIGCSSTNSIVLDSIVPTMNITTSPDQTICDSDSVWISVSGLLSPEWNGGQYFGDSIYVSPNINSIFEVTGLDSIGCPTDTHYINIDVIPGPALTLSSYADTICEEQSFSVTASGANSYLWSPINSTQATLVDNPTVSTSYTVIGTSNGCSDTSTYNIEVVPIPVISLTSYSDTICEGQSFSVTASGANSFVWTPGNITQPTLTGTPQTAATYTVIGNMYGCIDSTTYSVEIAPSPTVTLNAYSDTICEGQSFSVTASGATSYIWMPGNTTQATLSGTPSNSTIYTVIGTLNGCDDSTSYEIIVKDCANFTENDLDASVQIYPNPTSDNLNLFVETLYHEEVKLFLFDAAGKLVMTDQCQTNVTFELHLGSIAPGSYNLRVQTTSSNANYQVIVQ